MDKKEFEDKVIKKKKLLKYVCECFICGYKWEFPGDTDKDRVRAGCSPCGHQGAFVTTHVYEG